VHSHSETFGNAEENLSQLVLGFPSDPLAIRPAGGNRRVRYIGFNKVAGVIYATFKTVRPFMTRVMIDFLDLAAGGRRSKFAGD